LQAQIHDGGGGSEEKRPVVERARRDHQEANAKIEAGMNALGGFIYGAALASLFVLLWGPESNGVAVVVVLLLGACVMTFPRKDQL
jgi:hypothetical protein